MTGQAPPTQAATRFELPADPQAEVLRWTSSGGLSPTPAAPAEPAEPALLLRASGEFEARPRTDAAGRPGPRRRGRLSPDAMQALLAEVLVQHRLASLSGPAILAQIQAISDRSGRLFKVMDGGETTITVSLPAVRHTVTLPALHAAQRLFPEVADLQQLFAIQQRLLQMAETAR